MNVSLLFLKCNFPTSDQPCCFGTYPTVLTKVHFSVMQHSATFHIMINLSKLHRILSESISHAETDKQLLAYHTLPPTMPDECPTH